MEAAVEAGAEDLNADGDQWVVTCAPQDLAAVRDALEAAGMAVESAEMAMVPSTTVPVTEEGQVRAGAAAARGARRRRRRAERLVELRHRPTTCWPPPPQTERRGIHLRPRVHLARSP